ncbi:MAG TPA: DUF885 domain-containing protein [Steroidobacteraceae bacterium]|jgi:hypothetical protein|nr:DUF885 domain-containing protein [Steroidobacteraceae bacterium]
MALSRIIAMLPLALLAFLAGCNQSSKSPRAPVERPPSQASLDWQEAANGFMQSYFAAQPFFAAQEGKHEYDGQLPDLSEHGLKREIARLHAERDRIAGIDPKPLLPKERFDREYLLSVANNDLFWLEKTRYPYSNPYWYVGNIDPDVYLSRNYAPLNVRMKAYIKYARGIPQLAKDIQENLKGPLPKSYVELGIANFGGYVDFYKNDVTPVFASVDDPAMQKDLADADANAAQAMANLRDYLTGLRKTANDNFALGKDLYAEMVKDTDQVDVPIEQIEAAGRADLTRNTDMLKSACESYLPKGSLAACLAKMDANKPPQGTLEAARSQLTLLRDFVQKHNVVSIPGDQQALVAEAPPYNRENAAFIQVPGPYDKGVTAVYNIAPPNPKWSKREQAEYIPSVATLMFTSVHEVWPGHFLQFLHSNSNPDKLEALWIGYAYAEGWAHYCEEMMYDEGVGKDDPEMHIGQLKEALLRDVRLLSSIGMQTEGMTVAQSEKMFREQAFQDPGDARQQAARGTYDPAYLNYTLGKLMIKKLRADWIAKMRASGGAQAAGIPAGDDQAMWKSFHDQFLSYGGPPIPLVRKEMMGETGNLL